MLLLRIAGLRGGKAPLRRNITGLSGDA